MDHFNYDADGQLQAEQLPLQQLADQYGTPLYVYSRATLERHWHAFDQAAGDIPHLICYAVKANSNLALLNLLARLGSGFDIVSGGELSRVLAAGGDPAKVVFSGVAKSEAEMRLALEKEILCFNLESEAELERLNRVAGSMARRRESRYGSTRISMRALTPISPPASSRTSSASPSSRRPLSIARRRPWPTSRSRGWIATSALNSLN